MTGSGFRFTAPDGWKVTRTQNGVTAADGGRLVEVSTFPLARAYTTSLFSAVAKELNARMDTLAHEGGGTVAPTKPVIVAGIRSHGYRVETAGMVDEYVFVLRGKREFQLLCRRKSSDADDHCRLLLTSFRPA